MSNLCVVWGVIMVFFTSNCETITISYNGKNYDFNVNLLDRKIFYKVPIWTVQSSSSKKLTYNYEGISKTNGSLHEDKAMKAILFEQNNCRSNCWEGVFGFGTSRNVIGDNKPERRLLRKKDPAFNISGVYKAYPLKNALLHTKKSRSKVDKNNNNAFYPKLLLVIDNALFKKLDNDVEYATKYLSIFWSAVDLQYRNITKPQIEVRITGLIIAKDDKALHYISKNSPDGVCVNIDEVLYGSRKERVFIENTNITDYDAVVTMTGLNGYIEVGPHKVRVGSNGNDSVEVNPIYLFKDLKAIKNSIDLLITDNENHDKVAIPYVIISIIGVSWNGTICMDDYYFSVTSDDGSFSGIHSAVHELGHLLGLDHDAVPGNAFECFPTNRKHLSVMWPRYEDREIEIWSECSVRALKIFSEDDKLSSCCRIDPHQ